MSKVFKLNYKNFGTEVLQSTRLQEILDEKAEAIESRCGEGYEYGSSIGRNRALAYVRPATPEAKADNNQNNTLLKAVR